MITISVFLAMVGCLCLYYASDSSKGNLNTKWVTWLRSNTSLSNLIGIVLLLIVFFWMLQIFGLTSGILFWLFAVSVVMGLVVLFSPVKEVSSRYIILLFLLSLIFELIF